MTSDTAREPGAELSAWVRDHQVRWELAPVQEMVKGLGVQHTGYSLKLFGRLPAGARGDVAAARSVYARLHTLAAQAVQSLSVRAVLRVEPPGRAVVTVESQLVVEVELAIVASPAEPESRLPPAEVRRVIGLVEARLRSMGLRKS